MSDNPFNDQLWAQVCQAFDDGWDYGVQEKFNHKGKRAEGLRRAFDALRSAGFAVVPVEPTEGMRVAAVCTHPPEFVGDKPLYEKCWHAMLKAAQDLPPPPEVK